MMPFEPIGTGVPAWIRERSKRREEAWPLLALAAGTALSILVELTVGVILWTSDAAVYYARP